MEQVNEIKSNKVIPYEIFQFSILRYLIRFESSLEIVKRSLIVTRDGQLTEHDLRTTRFWRIAKTNRCLEIARFPRIEQFVISQTGASPAIA